MTEVLLVSTAASSGNNGDTGTGLLCIDARQISDAVLGQDRERCLADARKAFKEVLTMAAQVAESGQRGGHSPDLTLKRWVSVLAQVRKKLLQARLQCLVAVVRRVQVLCDASEIGVWQ